MTDRLSDIVLDDAGGPPLSPEAEQERRVAVFDLLEDNRFGLVDAAAPGPWTMVLSVRDGRARFDLAGADRMPAGGFGLALAPLRQALKDYGAICADYADAVRSLPPARIAELDEARRAIHEEAARDLARRLEDDARIDEATAKRLFTLICLLDKDPA